MTLLGRLIAIGVGFGLFAALLTVGQTPELARGPRPLLAFAGLMVAFYAAVGVVFALTVGAARALVYAFGLRLAGLSSGLLLWTLAMLGGGHVSLNHALSRHWISEAWKLPLRALLILTAVAVVVALVRRAPGRPRLALPERALLLALVPLVAYAALVVFGSARPAAAPTSAVAEGSGAPRFAPEPAAALAGASATERTRVILLGIDGASWDRIERGIAAGRLPSFERLRARGVHAPLGTLYPTWSPAIWTSMVTGVPPAAHDIQDFYLTQVPRLGVENLQLPRGFSAAREFLDAAGLLHRVPVTSSLRRRKALWNLADEAGLRSAVLGLWATWPPEPLEHGIVVSDHASLARRYEWLQREKTDQLNLGSTTHPPHVAETLARFQRAPDSVTLEELAQFVALDDALWQEFQRTKVFSKDVLLSAFRSTHLNDEFYLRSAHYLWETRDLDLMVVYVKAVDENAHFFLEAGVPEARALGFSEEQIARFGGVVDRTYEWTDRQIAPLLAAVDRDPDTLLVVVSDHGWEKESDGGYDHNDAPPGILILYGAGVCRTRCSPLREPTVYDVTPTLLTRLGLPLSDELAGRPLQEAFREPRQSLRVGRYGRALGEARVIASEIDAELNEKLEALGYVR